MKLPILFIKNNIGNKRETAVDDIYYSGLILIIKNDY